MGKQFKVVWAGSYVRYLPIVEEAKELAKKLAKMNAELVRADCTADSEVSHGALYGLASESAHTTVVWNTQSPV